MNMDNFFYIEGPGMTIVELSLGDTTMTPDFLVFPSTFML